MFLRAVLSGDDARVRGRDRVVAVIFALGVVLAIGVRLHVLDDDFTNPDIAGIAYNAELLLDGGLPYVDTVEIKPPGAFLLAAGSIACLGRSLEGLQLLFAAWLGLGALGVWLASMAVHAPSSGPDADDADDARTVRRTAAMAAMVALVTMAMFSYNYSAWMSPLSALAVGSALHGMRHDRRTAHVLAGAFAMLAVVTIQRAVVLAILLPALLWWARRRGMPGARPRAPIHWMVGAAAALLFVSLPWLVAGELEAFARGIVPLSVAGEYASVTHVGLATALGGALLQLLVVFWFPAGLLALSVLAAIIDREPQRAPDRAAWIPASIPGLSWLAVSIVAAGLGGLRFYLHYLVQYAPALALLAVHPALIRRIERGLSPRRTGPPGDRLVLTLGGLLVIGQTVEIGLGRGHRHESMPRRLRDGRTAAQAAGEHIRARTSAEDTVQAWGWTAWPIYWFSERRAPSRIYKPLGTVTTFNTNTEREVGEGPRFRPGPMADELIDAFDRAPPAYFVYSPSMVDAFGARPDPLVEFEALYARVREHYVPEARFGDLQVFRRRDHRVAATPEPGG